jgi:hypothetical protein
MANMRLRDPSTYRTVTEIGPGDYVKLGSNWHQVMSNSEFGNERIVAKDGNWSIQTTDGRSVSGWGVNAYAKADDLETT